MMNPNRRLKDHTNFFFNFKERGDVVMATGNSNIPNFLEKLVGEHLRSWKFLKDPCFSRNENNEIVRKENCF